LRIICLLIVTIYFSLATTSNAQYRLLPGNEGADGLPVTAARICLDPSGSAHCYVPPDYMKNSPFGLDPKARTVGKLNGTDLTLFTATFSGGGSGTLTNYALLAVKNGDFVNLLPKVQLTQQSEFGVWNLPKISPLPILLTADFVWDFKAVEASNGQEETHLAAHRYDIRVFVFDSKTSHYLERLHYVTDKKYPGLDEVDQIAVLEPEKQTIIAKLQIH
jgi:hypothetical protein